MAEALGLCTRAQLSFGAKTLKTLLQQYGLMRVGSGNGWLYHPQNVQAALFRMAVGQVVREGSIPPEMRWAFDDEETRER